MHILLIEDDNIEIMKLQRTVAKLGLNHKITEAKNGEAALEVLRSGNTLPDIVLLDLNMPRMSGMEFLKILKDDEVLQYLPTIILTTSENRVDLVGCYKIGIAGYIIKPLKYEDYQDKLGKVLAYWEVNELVKG